MVVAPVDVVGMGAVAWDRFLVVPRHPNPDEKIRAIAEYQCAGGTVATCLVALSRWGLKCRALSVVGFDEYSEQILADLASENVATEGVIRREDAVGRRSVILVDNRNGERCVVSGPHRMAASGIATIDPCWFDNARVFHVDASDIGGALAAIEIARSKGLKVTVDCERNEVRTEELLRHCDYLICPLSFAAEFTGQDKAARAAYVLNMQFAKPVVVTDGVRGCDYCHNDLAIYQPAFEVPVVDGTGAGDVFHAAFIYGLLAAWDVRRTLRFAAWAAAQTCRELGGRKGIPTSKEIHEFHRSEAGH